MPFHLLSNTRLLQIFLALFLPIYTPLNASDKSSDREKMRECSVVAKNLPDSVLSLLPEPKVPTAPPISDDNDIKRIVNETNVLLGIGNPNQQAKADALLKLQNEFGERCVGPMISTIHDLVHRKKKTFKPRDYNAIRQVLNHIAQETTFPDIRAQIANLYREWLENPGSAGLAEGSSMGDGLKNDILALENLGIETNKYVFDFQQHVTDDARLTVSKIKSLYNPSTAVDADAIIKFFAEKENQGHFFYCSEKNQPESPFPTEYYNILKHLPSAEKKVFAIANAYKGKEELAVAYQKGETGLLHAVARKYFYNTYGARALRGLSLYYVKRQQYLLAKLYAQSFIKNMEYLSVDFSDLADLNEIQKTSNHIKELADCEIPQDIAAASFRDLYYSSKLEFLYAMSINQQTTDDHIHKDLMQYVFSMVSDRYEVKWEILTLLYDHLFKAARNSNFGKNLFSDFYRQGQACVDLDAFILSKMRPSSLNQEFKAKLIVETLEDAKTRSLADDIQEKHFYNVARLGELGLRVSGKILHKRSTTWSDWDLALDNLMFLAEENAAYAFETLSHYIKGPDSLTPTRHLHDQQFKAHLLHAWGYIGAEQRDPTVAKNLTEILEAKEKFPPKIRRGAILGLAELADQAANALPVLQRVSTEGPQALSEDALKVYQLIKATKAGSLTAILDQLRVKDYDYWPSIVAFLGRKYENKTPPPEALEGIEWALQTYGLVEGGHPIENRVPAAALAKIGKGALSSLPTLLSILVRCKDNSHPWKMIAVLKSIVTIERKSGDSSAALTLVSLLKNVGMLKRSLIGEAIISLGTLALPALEKEFAATKDPEIKHLIDEINSAE